MPTTAARTALIEPFYVMELVKEAQELASAGRSVIHLSIGEPDFTAPEPVRRAAIATIERGETQYTAALGLPALRSGISEWYASRFNCDVPRERIVVTAGASGALLLACAALLDHDAELLMPDPSYPCNRHFATAFGGRAQLVPCGPEQRFQLTAADIELHWNDKTRGALVASPSNPTGTSIDPVVLDQLITAVQARHGFVISDEIYQGLSYDARPSTALQVSDRAVVINSPSNPTGAVIEPVELLKIARLARRHGFWLLYDDTYAHLVFREGGPPSLQEVKDTAGGNLVVVGTVSKSYCMTGWRVGWVMGPKPLILALASLAVGCAHKPRAKAPATAPLAKAATTRAALSLDEIEPRPTLSAAKPASQPTSRPSRRL